jgi:3-dehydroquinate dehydratase / shikimate dehydrogenase
MTKIAVSIIEENTDDCISVSNNCNTDLIELRIDYIKDINITKLDKILKNISKEIIITCRSKEFGGKYKGSEINRIKLLKHAISKNVKYIDIEIESDINDVNNLIKNKDNTKIILSHHNFDNTPPINELQKKYDQMNLLNPNLIKIVTFANSINDCFTIFRLLKDKHNLIGLCMGIKGNITRILAQKFNSYITYASVNKGKESAPGQLSINDLMNIYNFKNINIKTKILGVIGEHAENSKSKYMHNSNFKKLNLNYVYIPFIVNPNELESFMINFREFNFRGAAVTVPHKELIVNLIDNLDKTAKEIGATNTLVNNENNITGHNTDYYGAITALKEKTNIKDKKVLVIGAGGAARAMIYGLNIEKAKTTIINRTYEHAKKLGIEFDVEYDRIENLYKYLNNTNIIINTTSVGMNPNPNNCIIPKEIFPNNKIIMDIVYNPVETILIKLAKQNDCLTITGDKMLAYQAIGQFQKWTNTDPDFDLMLKKLTKNL